MMTLGAINHENFARHVLRYHCCQIARRLRTDLRFVGLEISFPGLSMGIFSGRLQFSVYRGANLLRQEAIAKTDEPSVAYKYQGGLKGFSTDLLPRIAWRDVHHKPQVTRLSSIDPGDQTVLRARNRLAVAEGQNGSVAFF